MPEPYLKYYLTFAKNVNRYLWSDKAIANRKWYIKYAFSLALVLLVTIVKLNYYSLLGIESPFLLYFGTVIIATGFGGIGPGIFTTVVTALLCDYFFLSSINTFILNKQQAIITTIYFFESLLLISLSGAVTRASRNLRRREERFRGMIENSNDAIVIANKRGQILYASPATEKILGYSSRDFRGMNAWGNVHDTEKDMLEKIFITLLQAPGATQTILHQFRDKNNTWQWIENTITNLTDHSAINGFVSNFRNVTDRILLERQKDDFVGVATHELKTPVTSIKAYTQILHNRFKREGNDNAAALLQKMDVQLDKLIGLIGDMLDVTKIEAGRLQYQENFYDLDSMVHEITEELQRTTDHHDIEVKMDGKPKIFGDRERISQVLSNLISNAIKYSPNCRTIVVTSNCCKDSVKLCVHDYGLGISEENQLKIFERFYRVSGPENNTFPGIGLGLYISHEIVKKQGGRLWVESKKGEGSVFCCELPYDYRTTNTKHFQSK